MTIEYTKSNMGKIAETYLLFKNSISSIERRAQLLYNTYSKMNEHFNLQGCHALELGAGDRGALIQLFDESSDVVGIDKYLGALDQGLWKAAKTMTRKLLFDGLLRYHLRKLNGGHLFTNRKVLNMDATEMQFAEDSFDLVYSRYFLEHIEPIEKIASETFRILKPGGATYHVFSLYTAIDGAHTLDWTRFQPWQHLTGTVPSNAYVNKYRLNRYVDAFSAAFGAENVEVKLRHDSGAIPLLTPELKQKLADYSADELLTGSPEIIARKPSVAIE